MQFATLSSKFSRCRPHVFRTLNYAVANQITLSQRFPCSIFQLGPKIKRENANIRSTRSEEQYSKS